MEVAGLVLGAVPLILYALEKYQQKNDEAEIRSLETCIELQKKLLYRTLKMLGIERLDEAVDMPMEDLGVALRNRHPNDWELLLDVVNQMNELMDLIARYLYPDLQEPPSWTNALSSRIGWEWDKVRHKFKKDALQTIMDKLRGWNNDLLRFVGHHEHVYGTESRVIEDICKRFDERRTRVIREEAQALYDAINACWGCTCLKEHQGNVRLAWHELAWLTTDAFTLAFPSRDNSTPQGSITEVPWRPLAIALEHRDAAILGAGGPTEDPAVDRVKTSVQVRRSSRKRSRASDSSSISKPDKKRIHLGRSSLTVSQSSTSGGSSTVNLKAAASKPCSTLCSLVETLDPDGSLLEYIPLPSSADGRCLRLSSGDVVKTGGACTSFKTVKLHSLLSESAGVTANGRLELDRKHRLGVAAALAWGVLYLCDSPWLSDSLSDEDICVFIDDQKGRRKPRVSSHPYFSHTFPLSGAPANTPSHTVTSPSGPTNSQFVMGQIKNITLYNLAIRLIELGSNRSFADLREDYYRRTQTQRSTGTGALIEDYAIAKARIERLRSDPGIRYANATDVCLRFWFLNPPENAPFEDRQFRSAFFRDVVAPVQATYEMTPALASDITD